MEIISILAIDPELVRKVLDHWDVTVDHLRIEDEPTASAPSDAGRDGDGVDVYLVNSKDFREEGRGGIGSGRRTLEPDIHGVVRW